MSSVRPGNFFVLLDSAGSPWQLRLGEKSAFVQVFVRGNPVPGAAFALREEPGAAEKTRALLRPWSGEGELKIVAAEGFEARAGELTGMRVFKMVSRAPGFDLRYDAASGKISVARAPEEEKKSSAGAEKTRVLIIDDSPTIRKLLAKILSTDPEVEIVGEVGLPSEAEPAIERTKPHVITLDIHLPEMTGVDLLKRYLPRFPIPTVMISSISMEEGPMVLSALEAGAVDYVQKPSAAEIQSVSSVILTKVKSARCAKVSRRRVSVARKASASGKMNTKRLIAIGSSTGGTEALREVLTALPKEIPPILIVQHIPPVFSRAFAERMNSLCPFLVVEGKDGEVVEPGKVIIAPGGFQMSLVGGRNGMVVRVEDAPPMNRHKPSVDFLFYSVAKLLGPDAVGLILTGMGADGAQGLLAMKKAGSPTLAQDEASSVVYGMPQAAFKAGAVDKVVGLDEAAAALVEAVSLPLGRKKTA